jgi:excisionase family DNA binding protein
MKRNGNFADSDYALSTRETARRLGLSVPATRKLLDSGELRSIWVGQRRRVPLLALRMFLNGQQKPIGTERESLECSFGLKPTAGRPSTRRAGAVS